MSLKGNATQFMDVTVIAKEGKVNFNIMESFLRQNMCRLTHVYVRQRFRGLARYSNKITGESWLTQSKLSLRQRHSVSQT